MAIIRKKRILIFLLLGFLVAIVHLVAGNMNSATGEISLRVVLPYGLAWASGLYSVWVLLMWLKQNYTDRQSWSRLEKTGLGLQALSLPILLIAGGLNSVLLFALNRFGNGQGPPNLMAGYPVLLWVGVIAVSGSLIYIGSKVSAAGNQELGSSNLTWGCAIALVWLVFFAG